MIATGKVEAYLVEENESRKKPGISGFPIIRKGKPLTKELRKQLVDTLRNDASYDFGNEKECAFKPSLAFSFTRDKRSANVLVCFSCKEVMFDTKGRSEIEDIDTVIPVFEKLKNELF